MICMGMGIGNMNWGVGNMGGMEMGVADTVRGWEGTKEGVV